MRPLALRPVAELAANKPHGNRVRYLAGCRCTPCRAANARYASGRALAIARGQGNGIVSAAPARAHLKALSRSGVGRVAVARASGVSQSIVHGIKSGRRPQIRAKTERAILAVSREARARGTCVPAGPTWRRIAALLEEGYTRAAVARLLGAKKPALQLGRQRVEKATAMRVQALHRRLTAIEAEP